MSNTSNDKAPNPPVNQPLSPPAANGALPNQEEPRAESSAPLNLDDTKASRQLGGLSDELPAPTKEGPAEAGNVDIGAPSKSAAIEQTLPLRQHAAQVTEGQGVRQASIPVPPASLAAHPSSAAAPSSMNPRGGAPETNSQPAGQAKVSTQAGGAVPPGLPPASVVASCPEEPRPTPAPTPTKTPGNSVPPPVFDVEEFIREAEDRKRGAKTMREIKALADSIRQLRQRGVSFGAIHRGLKERGLLTCSRSRFDEICADLFPDLLDPNRRGNA